MDAVVKKLTPRPDSAQNLAAEPEKAKPAYMDKPVTDRPSQDEVEAAVRTLLRWTGDDITREGLVDTPRRVANAFREMFSGYDQCPAEELGRTFEEV